jgi:hypothetical protein
MTRLQRLLLTIIGLFGIAGLLLNVASSPGQKAPQHVVGINPNAGCPDTSLQNIDQIKRESIVPIDRGINGLPCDAQIEQKSKPGTSLTESLQRGFDYYSWLTFLALNSPEGSLIGKKDAQAEWETWKQLPDVMKPKGVRPSSWGSLPDIPDACGKKFQRGMMVIHMEMEETYNEPFKSGPLFDQNGNYALFVIFMNKEMFDFITSEDNKLYSVEGQERYGKPIDFPSGDSNGPGAVMVKASWKIMTPKDDASAYHTVQGLLYLPGAANECREVKLGLIGFHVGHKTATRKQWIWTTFEHIKNVPTQDDVDSHKLSGPYNFYSAADTDKTHVNQVPAGPWGPLEMNPRWDPEHPSSFKSQIVRTGTFGPEFADVKILNGIFQGFLTGTVWANYELITTQWPSDSNCAKHDDFGTFPDSTCSPFPTFLANSTLETFSQSPPASNGGIPLATSSCISCHNNATTHHVPATRSDFTYILEKAQREHDLPK